jgi:hypothetical protein
MSNSPRILPSAVAVRLPLLLFLVGTLLPRDAGAQGGAALVQGLPASPASSSTGALPDGVAALEAALARDRDRHLWRVAGWGGANLLLGLGLLVGSDARATPFRRGFAIQTLAWGAINSGIAAAGLAADPSAPAGTIGGAWAAEDTWNRVLLLNVGLNAGYSMVGSALVIAAGRGLRSPELVRGHATSVIAQGAGLLVLDGVAWLASNGRIRELQGLVGALEGVSVQLLPAGVALGIPVP